MKRLISTMLLLVTLLATSSAQYFIIDTLKLNNAYKELLKDRDNVTFKLYENLNHCFVDETADNEREYWTELHIGEDVIADIANWIKEA